MRPGAMCMWLIKIVLYISCIWQVLSVDLSPGETTPRVEIAVGDSANISCRMNPLVFNEQNASDLYFSNIYTKQVVPASDIHIVNETTIVYMLRNASAQNYVYRCNCGNNAIMDTSVNVGWKPEPISDFSCSGYDFEYMVCQFMRPYNPVLVTYNLTFFTRTPNYRFAPVCSYERTPLVVCNITNANNYNSLVEMYHFILVSNNSLGQLSQSFPINNLNVMVPAAPGEDFRVEYIRSNETEFVWHLHKHDMYKQRGLQWEALLQAHHLPEQQLYGVVRKNESPRQRYEYRLHFKLPFANFNYTLQLRVKVNTSNTWSAPFVYSFRSWPSLPARAPTTKTGSFYIDPSETTVRIYWEELELTERNGDDFAYVISQVKKDSTIITLKPLQMESTSAVFAWQKHAAYEFEIRSRNNIGDSLNASRIQVPVLMNQRKTKSHTPRAIHNVYHATNRTYTLSWLPPEVSDSDFDDTGSLERNDRLLSYTVYWCQSKRALQNECKGTIRFVDVPATQNKYTTMPQSAQQEHTLNLAVSANYENFNTGMHWTTCTLDVNSDLIKMEPEARVMSASVINVQWSSENVCPSILLGYNLSYCEVSWPTDANSTVPIESTPSTIMEHITCRTPVETIKITDQNAKRYNLEKLKPYTTYRIEMNMYSRTKVGKQSDPLYVRTAEAASTPPRQLQVSHITNTSAVISWLPPTEPNGIIKNYVVNLNNEQHWVAAADFEHIGNKHNERLVHKLQNLMSNKQYKLYVTAYTVSSSDPSNILNFTTRIGYPQAPRSVNAHSEAENATLMVWSKPNLANGRLEFYEVAVTQLRKDEIVRRRISIVNGTSCAVSIPTCIDHAYKTKIDVRAVNVALIRSELANELDNMTTITTNTDMQYYMGNEELRCIGSEAIVDEQLMQKYRDPTKYHLYRSEWQFGPNYNCSDTRLSRITIIALLVVVTAVGVMIGLYMARKQINKMADIHCTLPPGLDIFLSKDNSTMHAELPINNCSTGMSVTNSSLAAELALHQQDAHTFHNEKHHLLAAIGNDSGYLDDATRGLHDARESVMQSTTPIPADYVRSHSHSSSDSLVDSNASTAEAEIDACGAQTQMNMTSYVKPANLSNWLMSQHMAEKQEQLNDYSTSDYIPVNALRSEPRVTVDMLPRDNGYIHPVQFVNKPITTDGYSTLEELNKTRNDSLTAEVATKETPISGYVTPGDLNMFGTQQKEQQRQQQTFFK